jgi:glycerophosphoryl diester phosphodiesterase
MRPENTLAAFAYAIEVGADALEMDLAVTKDGVLVVSHDPELNREICQAPAGSPTVIRQSTLDQVRRWDCGSLRNPHFPKQQTVPGERIPTLDEVLALAPRGTFLFNIEIKIFRERPGLAPSPQRFAELLLAAIRSHELARRVIVQSFDFRALLAMHGLAREIQLSALDEVGLGDFVSVARSASAAMISPHYRLVTPAKVEAAHAAGVQVVPWTANAVEVWDDLIAAGVDAIITDDPAALIAHLRQKGLR